MTPQASPSRATPYGVLRHYWRVAGVRPWHIVLPTVLVLVAGVFEAASFSMLLPLTSAVELVRPMFLDRWPQDAPRHLLVLAAYAATAFWAALALTRKRFAA